MRIIDCEQGSDVWLKARCGKITASRMADVLNYKQPSAAQAKQAGFALVRDAVAAGVRGDESQVRADYRIELIAERLTGLAEDRYVSAEMKWGTDNEPFARAAYEVETGNMIDLVGFVLHPSLDCAGASPDGLYGRHGGVELKCPKSTTHLGYLEVGVVPEEYIPQMTWEMVCCERDWMDFVSFDPRMPDDLQLFIVRLNRDEAAIAAMEAEVVKFEGEIQAQIARIRGGLLRPSVPGDRGGVSQSRIVQPLYSAVDTG